MRLSVIIPVYNEERTIEEILRRVKKVGINKEIIIVDDGSTDGTRDILNRIKKKKSDSKNKTRIIFHPHNKGKGSAIRTALKYVTGDIVIIQDADLELDPADFKKLIKPIIQGKTKVVYGARFLKNPPKINILSKIANFAVTFTANVLYGAKITDEAAGYKVFKTDVIKSIRLECERFEFCPEVTAKLCKSGYKIYEVPVSFYPRSWDEGKKINWKDGVEAMWTLLKYRFKD